MVYIGVLMFGSVIWVVVEKGDKVLKGDYLMIIEVMKMEIIV